MNTKPNPLHKMKTRPITTLIAAAALLAACGEKERPGCTYPLALNHDPAATFNDGSCAYLSGLYAGNWIARDTTVSYNPQTGDTTVETISYGFSMSAIGHERVRIAGWIDPDCMGMDATVSRTLLVPEAIGCEIQGFTCTHADGRLRYGASGEYHDFRGTALKQD
jgi:hypothetical protein